MIVNLELRELIAPVKVSLKGGIFFVSLCKFKAQGRSIYGALEVLEEVLLEEIM